METLHNIPKFYVLGKIFAFFIDIFISFVPLGFIIAYFTGDVTSAGFSLEGLPALLLFVLVITYFFVGNKYFGGTIGKRVMRL